MKEDEKKRECARGKEKEPRGGTKTKAVVMMMVVVPLGGGEGINACQKEGQEEGWDGRREEDRGGRKTTTAGGREDGRDESTSRVWSSYK